MPAIKKLVEIINQPQCCHSMFLRIKKSDKLEIKSESEVPI